MSIQSLDKDTITIKKYFDGYDFFQTMFGSLFRYEDNYQEYITTTYLPELYDNVDNFITFCDYKNDGYLPVELMQKYKCGLYDISFANDINNPWKNNNFILFNQNRLNELKSKVPINNIKFWVCPAFDEKNNIYAIGFRVTNIEEVKNAFKWIFTCGNNIIYGRNTVDKSKPCYVVEGYRDYIALNELGYNVIGLGSVFISKVQEEYLSNLTDPIILFDNDKFGLKQTLHYKDKYRIATLIQTKEKDAWDTYIKNIPVRISEIK